MFDLLKQVLGGDKKRYEKEKKLLTSGSLEDRQQLANNAETHPEILYFLAKDDNAEVRLATATNVATPVQASAMLAHDKSVDVRMALAARLVDLLPNLSVEKHSQLYSYAVQALGVLAHDEVLKIRQALSTSLKDHAKAPPKVVGQLARDVEREVSEPVLRCCLTLTDEDLLDILGKHPDSWVISAISSRPVVSARVSDAVVNTKDVPANTVLLRNSGAIFSKETLLKIVETAVEFPEWHEPIAVRKEISFEMAQKLAGYVGESVLTVLEQRDDFDAETSREISALVKRRLEFQRENAAYETSEQKVERYIKSGKLDANVVHDALSWKDHKFVMLALSYLSKIHPLIVEKMLKSGTAKSIVALSWKAQLPMRLAVELQRSYAQLQPHEFLYAKGGTDYPMTLPEIKWQLEFYGVEFDKK